MHPLHPFFLFKKKPLLLLTIFRKTCFVRICNSRPKRPRAVYLPTSSSLFCPWITGKYISYGGKTDIHQYGKHGTKALNQFFLNNFILKKLWKICFNSNNLLFTGCFNKQCYTLSKYPVNEYLMIIVMNIFMFYSNR